MIVGGWQVNNILSFVSGAPFTVTSAATSLNLPGSSQTADQVVPAVRKIGAVGRTVSYFDPLSFRPVTEARFGTAGLNSLRGPGIANWDFSVFRQFHVTERWRIEFRMEAFNFSNTPHFSNPAANVSNLSFNPDGTVRDLGGFSAITSTSSQARDGIDERQFRLGIRIAF